MGKIKFFICMMLVLAVPSSAMGFLPLVDVEAAIGVHRPSPSGSLGAGGDPLLDIEDDFSLGSETEWFGRLKVDMPFIIPNGYLWVNPVTFSSSTTDSFTFKGKEFDGRDGRIDTKLKLDHYDFALYYSIPILKRATLDRLNVDAGLNFRYIDARARVSESESDRSASESMSIVIPQIYLGAQFQPVERISLEAEARAITYMGDRSYSLAGRVKAGVFGPLFVAGGYRYDDYDIEKGGLELDFNFSGPFMEAGVTF